MELPGKGPLGACSVARSLLPCSIRWQLVQTAARVLRNSDTALPSCRPTLQSPSLPKYLGGSLLRGLGLNGAPHRGVERKFFRPVREMPGHCRVADRPMPDADECTDGSMNT